MGRGAQPRFVSTVCSIPSATRASTLPQTNPSTSAAGIRPAWNSRKSEGRMVSAAAAIACAEAAPSLGRRSSREVDAAGRRRGGWNGGRRARRRKGDRAVGTSRSSGRAYDVDVSLFSRAVELADASSSPSRMHSFARAHAFTPSVRLATTDGRDGAIGWFSYIYRNWRYYTLSACI